MFLCRLLHLLFKQCQFALFFRQHFLCRVQFGGEFHLCLAGSYFAQLLFQRGNILFHLLHSISLFLHARLEIRRHFLHGASGLVQILVDFSKSFLCLVAGDDGEFYRFHVFLLIG